MVDKMERPQNSIKILAFAGSLRRDSYNKALINTAKELAPDKVDVEIFDLSGIPLFNQDEESSMPEKVRIFKKKIEEADAILIATPEYNRSVPGVLKNAIDWASRPRGNNSFNDKPVAVMGATGGQVIGTYGAQAHLMNIFSYLNMHVLEKPQLFIAGASEKISGGKVIDDATRELIGELMRSIERWTRRLTQQQ